MDRFGQASHPMYGGLAGAGGDEGKGKGEGGLH